MLSLRSLLSLRPMLTTEQLRSMANDAAASASRAARETARSATWAHARALALGATAAVCAVKITMKRRSTRRSDDTLVSAPLMSLQFWNTPQDVLTEAVALLAMWLDPALRLSRVALPQWVLLALGTKWCYEKPVVRSLLQRHMGVTRTAEMQQGQCAAAEAQLRHEQERSQRAATEAEAELEIERAQRVAVEARLQQLEKMQRAAADAWVQQFEQAEQTRRGSAEAESARLQMQNELACAATDARKASAALQAELEHERAVHAATEARLLGERERAQRAAEEAQRQLQRQQEAQRTASEGAASLHEGT